MYKLTTILVYERIIKENKCLKKLKFQQNLYEIYIFNVTFVKLTLLKHKKSLNLNFYRKRLLISA